MIAVGNGELADCYTCCFLVCLDYVLMHLCCCFVVYFVQQVLVLGVIEGSVKVWKFECVHRCAPSQLWGPVLSCAPSEMAWWFVLVLLVLIALRE